MGYRFRMIFNEKFNLVQCTKCIREAFTRPLYFMHALGIVLSFYILGIEKTKKKFFNLTHARARTHTNGEILKAIKNRKRVLQRVGNGISLV